MVKRLLIGALLILLILFAVIGPIDRTVLPERSFYQKTLDRIEHALKLDSFQPTDQLRIGWSTVNITPYQSMPMAGYKPRNSFADVHDSLMARVLSIDNGGITVYLVTADLLLFPRALKDEIQTWINMTEANDFVYFSATHTHNGVGGWDTSLVGRIVLGSYHEDWVKKTSRQIIDGMMNARDTEIPGEMAYWKADASEFVTNRLVSGAESDGILRGIQFVRNDSTKGILFSFSGHPTNISQSMNVLSADYPGEVIKNLQNGVWGFGMFMAGMVGSHSLVGIEGRDFDRVAEAGKLINKKISNAIVENSTDSPTIEVAHIPLVMGGAQLRIAKNFKIRDWLFRLVMQPLQAEITYLRINDILLLGTSCDFSGEIFVVNNLDSIAEVNNKHLMITSFNGDYTGYITEDSHYDEVNKEEVRALNWVGPYYGQYYTEIIKELVQSH